jgi:hypothetical protein
VPSSYPKIGWEPGAGNLLLVPSRSWQTRQAVAEPQLKAGTSIKRLAK